MDEPFVAELGRKLAKALTFLHSGGIIHRDLRPQNVVLSPDYEPIVIDFGFARRLAATGKTSLPDKWSAPEVRHDNPTWTTASDVYSLGATLRDVLVPGKGESSLTELLDRCCHFDPGSRPATSDLQELFREVAGELHVDARKEQIWTRVVEFSKVDRAGCPWLSGILEKFRPKFEALALGCGSSQFYRAREAADFLNQALEAARGISLGKAVATERALAGKEIRFLQALRNFESHGEYRREGSVLSDFGNPNDLEIRELTLNGAKQMAGYLSVSSLADVVEAVI
jgi:serine/threonine protein kinase